MTDFPSIDNGNVWLLITLSYQNLGWIFMTNSSHRSCGIRKTLKRDANLY